MLHFKEFQKENRGVSMSAMRKKLYSALAMLLVASTLMVSSTYAWFVLSTAPEVTGIETQVGANGALELALLSTESWNDLTLLDMGDFDESDTTTRAETNLTWGNLVNLGDPSYGLSKISLMPSRLYIESNGTDENGTDAFKINNTLLKTPIYGEDGRIQALDKTSAISRVCTTGGNFSEEGHGVRAIGISASMSQFQLGMNGARSAIVTYTAAARTKASNTLNSTGGALANIVVQYALNNKTTGYTVTDMEAAKALAEGIRESTEQIELALRQVFAAYITTEEAGVAEDDYNAALTEINDTAVSLSDLLAKYPGAATLVEDLGTYITKLGTMENTADTAISNSAAKIAAGGPYSWTDISGVVYPMMDTDQMLVCGKEIDDLQSSVRNPDGSINMGAALELVQGGITIAVPTGSGILSDIADFAGNYSAKVTVEGFSYGEYGPMNVDAAMKTATVVNPVYLTNCSNSVKGGSVASGSDSDSITDFYGYALDLAFRTNAENSNLLLQTEPENRVYEGSNENANLQGGGSYMEFSTQAGLSATKMIKLMSAIRVVFMDDEQNVLGIAALDTTLGKDVYKEYSTEEKVEYGCWAYLDFGPNASEQVTNRITSDEYDWLADESAVQFDADKGTIKAKLYLQNFELTKNASNNLTGGLTIRNRKADSVIAPLTQDVAKCVSVVVYLDGGTVNNSMVAADSSKSMSGTLNLQFSSDATLIPAEISALRSGDSDVTYNKVAEAGETYEFNNVNYTVKDSYTIYSGSDNKLYYSSDGDNYIELTAENAVNVLEAAGS